nr:hypothetical protein [Tanacetum cinerariifolium]
MLPPPPLLSPPQPLPSSPRHLPTAGTISTMVAPTTATTVLSTLTTATTYNTTAATRHRQGTAKGVFGFGVNNPNGVFVSRDNSPKQGAFGFVETDQSAFGL